MSGDVTSVMLALSNPNPSVRTPAERMVAEAQESNFPGFVVALLEELKDDNKPDDSRMMAGIILKNSVALDSRSVQQREMLDARWKSLSRELRCSVKTAAISTLGCSRREVRITASIIIANLARIELPHGEWPELITTLCAACSSGVAEHMEAGLTALGFVCEEADSHDDMATVMEKQSQAILEAIRSGLEQTEMSVVEAAALALRNAIDFIHENMKDENVQGFLITKVCEMIQSCPVERIRMHCMCVLVRFAQLYYSLLPKYINKLFDVTSGAIARDKELVGVQALLFWDEVAVEEDDRGDKSVNIIKTGGAQLVEIAVQCLQRQEEHQTQEDWNLSIAASRMLKDVSKVLGDSAPQLVMPFVYSNVSSDDWRKREAAFVAFGCVLSAPDHDSFANTAAQSVPMLLGEVNTVFHPLVADTAAWVLGEICELFPLCFTENSKHMFELMTFARNAMGSDDSNIVTRGCNVVHNIALYYEDEENMPTNALSPYFDQLASCLLSCIDRRNDDVNARPIAVETLNVLIDAAAGDVTGSVNALMKEVLDRLKKLVMSYQENHSDDVLTVQGLLCGGCGSVAKKLGKASQPYLPAIMEILNAILQQQDNTTVDEAIMLIGTLASASEEGFAPYLDGVLPVLLRWSFGNDEEDIVTAAVGALGNVAGALGPMLAPRLEAIVPPLLKVLADPNVMRELKVVYLGCLGDIALFVSDTENPQSYVLQPYITTILSYAAGFFQQSMGLTWSDGSEDNEYVMDLWEVLSTLCSQLVQSMRPFPQLLIDNIQGMTMMAVYIIQQESRLCEDTCVSAAVLLGDMANAMMEEASRPYVPQAKTLLLNADVDAALTGLEQVCTDSKVSWARVQLRKLYAMRT